MFLFFVACLVSAQTNYFVNTSSGNDSNSPAQAQNPATPWKTLQHANDNVTVSGSGTTIHVSAGTYAGIHTCPSGQWGIICVTKGGISPTARLVWQCDTPATLSMLGTTQGCFLSEVGDTSVTQLMISIEGSGTPNNLDITGFHFGPQPAAFDSIGGVCNNDATPGSQCPNLNSVHVVGNLFEPEGATRANSSSFCNSGNLGAMIEINGRHGHWVSDAVYQNNIIMPYGTNACKFGYAIYANGKNQTIYGNLTIGSEIAIHAYDEGCGMRISNNTIINPANYGLIVWNTGDFAGDSGPGSACSTPGLNTVNNNIIVNAGVGYTPLLSDSGSGMQLRSECDASHPTLISNNLMAGNAHLNFIGYQGASPDSCASIVNTITSQSVAQTFVNYQPNGTGNYHLLGGSLAINGGTTTCVAGGFTPCTPTVDITNTPIGTPPPVGAYTFAGSGGPVVSLSTTTLAFGNQGVGASSPPQSVILSNVGTSSLAISGIAITVAGSFTQTNNCPASLGASLSCTIAVTFTPAGSGLRTSSLSITDNASGSPQPVALNGTGTTASMTVSPLSLSYGNSTVGTPTGFQSTTITNNGTSNVTLNSASTTILGTNPNDFPFFHGGSNTCVTNQVLVPGASCIISAIFSPTAVGSRTATLTVVTDASNSPQNVALSGTGVATAPSVSLAPTSLTFAPQLVNTTSASQTVTLTNNGTASLTISSTSASGDFARTTTCGAALAVNASCTLSVTFTPTAVGNRNGTLSITDNASGSPHTVSLTGTGTAGATLFAPTSITFGSQTVGSSTASVTETLTNNGTATLTGIGVTLTGTNPGDFGIVNSCPSSLAVNASCNVAVTFTPTTTGSRTANVHFVSSALNSPQDVALSGTGAAATASVTLSPTSLTFTNQATGTTSAVQTILVTSSGSATLTISSIAKTGSDVSQFNLTNPCPGSLSLGSSCTLSVTFSPTTIGAKTAAITLTDNAGDSPQSANLTGTGASPPTPVASLSTTSLTFGSRNVNSASAAQVITVNSTGTASLVISSVTTSGDYSQTNNCGTVPVGSSCTINVIFTPTAIGTRTSTVTITDNAADSPQTVSLSGTSLGSTGTVAPTSLSFGNQGIGTASVAQNVTLSNSGNVAQSFSVSFTNPDFSETDPCSGSVPPGTNCIISVAFTPSAIGTRTGNMVVSGSALNSPQTVALSGIGVQASLSISPTLLPFGNQAVGTSSGFLTSTVTNVGTAPSHITSVTITGPNNAEFSIGTNTCVTTLQPTTSCNILVRFSPAVIGTKSAAVTIVDDAPGSPHMISLTSTGTSVIANLLPTSISFGNQPVGTQTAGSSSTLTNTGTADYAISSIAIGSGGTPGDFTETNNCPATLTAGNSCIITAKFLPTAAGSRTATVNVVGTVNTSLPLSGTGTLPNTSFSINPVAFGNQGVATGVTKTTVLTNTGLAPLHITSSSLVKTGCSADLSDTFSTGSLDGSKWLISTGNAPGNIAGVNAGSFSTSNVDLSQGVLTMRVTQSGNAPVISSGAQIQSVNTFGFGTFEWILRSASSATSPAGAGLPTSGQISSGFNFINNSQTEIDFEIEGQFPSLVEQTTWFTTATNQETNYTAPFQPDQGFHHYKFVWFPGIVQFFVDGVLSATHTNNVPVTPAFVLMNIWGTNSTSFGGNAVVGTARRMFVSGFTHTPATCGAAVGYTQTNNCPGTLNPSSSCTYNVTFTPTAAGENDAFLQVVTDAPVTPSLVSLTGNGIAPAIVLSPPSFDYGNVALGVTVPETFVVLNSGTGPATISSVSVPAGDFSILSQNCVGTLAAGNSCSIVVNFIPSVASVRTSTLTVADNAAGNPHTAALRGTGINTGGQTSLILGGAMDAGGNLQVGVH